MAHMEMENSEPVSATTPPSTAGPFTMATGSPTTRFPYNSAVNGLLVRVLARQAINVAFQPIISLSDGRVVGYEALARPISGSNEVGGFFAAAEKQGVVKDLDSLCRRAAVTTGRKLPEEVFLSINMSSEVLTNSEMDTDVILELIDSNSLTASRIVLEVQAPDDNAAEFLAKCQPYRRRNFRIAVSGVESQNASVLAPGTMDLIKLARSVTKGLDQPETADFIKNVLHFAGMNSVEVVAEGIETEEMKAVLTGMGVPYGQGFHIAKPAPIHQFIGGEPEQGWGGWAD